MSSGHISSSVAFGATAHNLGPMSGSSPLKRQEQHLTKDKGERNGLIKLEQQPSAFTLHTVSNRVASAPWLSRPPRVSVDRSHGWSQRRKDSWHFNPSLCTFIEFLLQLSVPITSCKPFTHVSPISSKLPLFSWIPSRGGRAWLGLDDPVSWQASASLLSLSSAQGRCSHI